MNVARPGPWGNPFVAGRDGTRERCVELYRILLSGNICLSGPTRVEEQRKALRYFDAHISELRGKVLGCWCPDGKPCHADVLLELANRWPPSP